MKKWIQGAGVFVWVAGLCLAAQGQQETHTNVQSVTATGASAWTPSFPFTLRGVLLNNPEDMLEAAWDPESVNLNRMGGQWQVFIQAVADGDRGGTALWLGQNYSSVGPWIPAGNFYGEEAWSNLLFRVNFDTNSLHHFRAGDLVEVTANQSVFYGGKRNINEGHRTNDANNFYLSLVEAGRGLPDPEVILLTNLVSSGTNQIFDQTRQFGGERYQGVRVRIERIRMATEYFGTNGWGKTAWADRRCTVTDGEGRYFTVRMPLADLGPLPADWFSAIGLINQESGSGTDGTHGYELFVQEIGPTIRTLSSGGGLMMAWSGAYTNYVLEYSTNISEGAWSQVETAPAKWIVVEEPLNEENRIYRLRQRD